MATIATAEEIEAIWDALHEVPGRRHGHEGAQHLKRLAADGWAMRVDIEDIILNYDSRLGNVICADRLVEIFGFVWRDVCERPRARSNMVSLHKMLAAADVAVLLMNVEQLGFEMDSKPMAEALLPGLKKQKRLTNSELSVLWFNRYRHKMEPYLIQVDAVAAGVRSREEIKTRTGYRVELHRDGSGRALRLTAYSPKYRRAPERKLTDCAKCGFEWVKGDPDSSAAHRKEHKRRMAVLDPVPNLHLKDARRTEAEPELVQSFSPPWKHAEMYERARRFKKEMGFDFTQWHSAKGDPDPNVHGYLFAGPDDTILGACAFRPEPSGRWRLDWVWVRPGSRRMGVLTHWWPKLRERFGDFYVSRPVSKEMRAFVMKQGDGNLLRHAPASTDEDAATDMESVDADD